MLADRGAKVDGGEQRMGKLGRQRAPIVDASERGLDVVGAAQRQARQR
jgi:hypothetical protein